MMKPRLNTSVEIKGSLQEAKTPSLVRIPLTGGLSPVVKKKQVVARGQVIAENLGKSVFGIGFMHASIDGVVEDLLPGVVVLGPVPAPKEGEAAPELTSVQPCAEIAAFSGEELCRKLLELGVDTTGLRPSRTLIINGLNPEPGVTVSEQLLADVQQTLEAGIGALERAVRPGTIKLVVAQGKNSTLHGCTTVQASDCYPSSLNALVVYAATGAENPKDVNVISMSELYRIGHVVETGLPVLDAVVTVGETTLRVPIGMPMKDVLQDAGLDCGAEWKIALGGPMRGQIVGDPEVGVPKDCSAITLVRKGVFPEVGSGACVNCGECVLACPARIQPGMISRYAEFGLFEETQPLHIAACMECGMCAFVCPANRPMLQYLRLAKEQLASKEDFVAACRLQE